MPALPASEKVMRRRIAGAEIEASIIRSGLTPKQIMVTCGFKESTLKNRKEEPLKYTLDQLQRLAKKTNMSPLQAASVMLGRQVTASEIK